MALNDTILPSSVAVYGHIAAFDVATKAWLEELQLDVLAIYVVDLVDSRALYYLAEQFDVLAYKGWNLCDTDSERRQLIKSAIELHRYKGTPWAIRESLKRVGFTDVTITEGVNGHWARFSLKVDNQQVTVNGFTDIINMVEEYKPVRSVLDSVNVSLEVDDIMTLADLDEAFATDQVIADDTVYFTGAAFYDGDNDYDGTIDHSGDADVVIIT